MKNLDLFGNEVEAPDPPRGRRKTPTMQEMFGVKEGKTCSGCVHCVKYFQSKTWYKCELWTPYFPTGNSESSDIRLKNLACGKYISAQEMNESADLMFGRGIQEKW